MEGPTDGVWVTFPHGKVAAARGGRATLKLAEAPIATRFVRLWMTESSDTCDTHGTADRRNCVGYAIREVYVGSIDGKGAFTDTLHHAPDQSQTATYCSSIDPWHAASDVHDWGDEADQTGLDLFLHERHHEPSPAIIPVSVLYGTPEDSAAQIAYVKKRGYPIAYVEMGEEPDGPYMLPEDYAALYLEWAAAIHRVAPEVKLGGPSFTGVDDDVVAWPDAQGRTSWRGALSRT